MSMDDIEHIIVLMLENRSFDHMLGGLKSVMPELDGIDPDHPGSNSDAAIPYHQEPNALRVLANDPKHEHVDVMAQLEPDVGTPNGGFIRDFARAFPRSTSTERAQVMAYFPPASLPATHTLARSFTVCDRWFSSLPGPTW